MTDEKMAVKWVTVNTGFNPKEPLGKIAIRIFLAGLKAGEKKVKEEYEVKIKALTLNRDELLTEIERLEERVDELKECY